MNGPGLAAGAETRGTGVPERRRIVARGTVQGVGFRPFVHRLAHEHGLAGWVRNSGAGVEMEVEGPVEPLEAFARGLHAQAPPLARIEGLEVTLLPSAGSTSFAILPSTLAALDSLPVSPDMATCAACLAELLDPAERRHHYPFTNCTDCGPRFTIIEALPYDRARTTMRAFPLCASCRAEYEDPSDRRFHAEPIACPACGPRVTLAVPDSEPGVPAAGDPIQAAADALRAGRIVAVKGLGGFQLACDARNEAAVGRLRERKGRDAKPFALMVPDLATARALCHVTEPEAAALAGPRAPIVLLRRLVPSSPELSENLAPRLNTLGIMLPYTPLHHLLLATFGRPLILTSGNRSDEPIARDDDEAATRLAQIADAFLAHDRPIASRYDDSVVMIDGGAEVVLRRARGYAPEPIRLPRAAVVPLLAVGAQLKGAFCLVKEDRAFVGQHIGDLDDPATLAHYDETLAVYSRLFGIDPLVVAHDLHPDYATTRLARSLEVERLVGVQHHHAHVASCAAEHGVCGPVIGVALDGAGLGLDGAIWGGELIVADGPGFRRLAHLAYLPLPGRDAAARQPWRMALAALDHAFGDEAAALAAELLARIPEAKRTAVLRLARSARLTDGTTSSPFAPPTSSAGRLFDAVAALAGVRDENRYEGQAAMELEARLDHSSADPYPLPLLVGSHGPQAPAAVWDLVPLIRGIVDDVRRGAASATIAARFHDALAAAVTEGCIWAREREGLATVALSGGCFQSRRLLERVRAGLHRAGFRVLTHRLVPSNDGGISLGQAAVAVAALEE